MRFFKLLPVALVIPGIVMASPTADIYKSSEADLAVLIERQTSLTDLLSELTASLAGIKNLLSATSLNNIEEVVTDLATLFRGDTTNQTKALIGTASNLLGGTAVTNLIGQLPTLLSSVSGLVTPALITNLTDILGNAHDLLTPAFVTETKTLIADVAPLVSAISQVISALIGSVLGAK